MTTKTGTMIQQKIASSKLSADDWERLQLDHLPNYDPYATAIDGDWFDVDSANRVVDFFSGGLRLIEGEWAGEPFELQDWQKAATGALFGWKREDGTRRYREAFIYVPKKNGKSPWVAGMLCFVLFTDNEPAAQIYAAACDRDQASIVYKHASEMIKSQPALNKKVKHYKSFRSIEKQDDLSVFRVLSSDVHTKDGLNTHFYIIDEVHRHKTPDLIELLEAGVASRRQPLGVYITTADSDRPSVCNDKLKYAHGVCKPIDDPTRVDDHAFLPVIYEATKDDDWESEKTWERVNPNYGLTVKKEYMERLCQKAKLQPSYEATFKRLHLNIVTGQAEIWIPMELWRANNMEIGDNRKRQACGGLDLGATSDLTSFCLTWQVDGHIESKWWHWICEESARQQQERDGVPWSTWAQQGWCEITEGNEMDYRLVRKRINEIGDEYSISEIAADRLFQGAQLCQDLADDGFDVIPFGMGFYSMFAPSVEWELRISRKEYYHGGNPVMEWQIGHLACKTDEAGCIKPDKKKSKNKIDGVVAGIMALGRSMVGDGGLSGYEDDVPIEISF